MISLSSALPSIMYSARLNAETPLPETPPPVEEHENQRTTTPPPIDGERLPPSGVLSKDVITQLQGAEESGNAEEAAPPPPPPQDAAKPDDGTDSTGLTEAEQVQIDALQARDTEVRTHEQAHAASGGAYAGSPSYEYETGPDGQQYAVGGSVSIDTSPITGDPTATISKMNTIIRAALAPAEPSGQDRTVAATASKLKMAAQAELNAEKQAVLSGDADAETDTSIGAMPQNDNGTPPPQERSPTINVIA